jgi:hypothetical protein
MSRPRLAWKKPRSLTIERIRQQDSPEGILVPIAEAAAVLLATADFSLVKRWFYQDWKRVELPLASAELTIGLPCVPNSRVASHLNEITG